ncbi:MULTISPECIES: 2-hydroxyacid dehydrogenase [unclassified Spirosoma]|mgnify:CR=1 FL=1|uniref:2-hydroxyacid dehydrogenase n=1 Tax=unclassified Spirosoma TaxID=2621999 RepID=UPI00095EAC1F|nr:MULTISPECIES: 2-hydroxyacid dehydrogenase [unclassified Spirosoma]MBN8826336.1 2-hydroxyacid dehydrogenase [Spirosoma sp.]OJW76146.1 MAG: hydroxyacid dehydrogenase [Spirosoma sp. 48-14]
MNIAFFSAFSFEKPWFGSGTTHQITFIEKPLSLQTVELAKGHQAVCAFANDDLSRPVLLWLKKLGVSVVGMRCVGLDNVDQQAMDELGITLLMLPGLSPYSVAEQAAALVLGLVRHLPEAHERVQLADFRIDGLVGTDLHGKTVGIIGTGRIGRAFAKIMLGFGCKVIAYDLQRDPALIGAGVQYGLLAELLQQADILSLHCSLTPLTEHLINDYTLAALKPTAILVNTARGGIVDTVAVLKALDAGQLAGYGADVYERERPYFHYDFSGRNLDDSLLDRLCHHPNVLLTAHQGFLTEETLQQMAQQLLQQFSFYENQKTIHIPHASVC